jgi:membrane protease YdiL (CAAX protease family)
MKLFFLKGLKFLFLYLLIVGVFFYVGGLICGVDLSSHVEHQESTAQTLVISLFSLMGSLLVVWLFVNQIDKHDFCSIGLQKAPYKDYFFGFSTGLLVMVIGFLLLLGFHQLNIATVNYSWKNTFFVVLIYASISISEEIVMRGYVLNKLMLHYNKWVALVISSAFFSAMHFFNPHIGVLSAINLFFAGVLLGLPYIFTKNLWFSISLHFSWNLFQGLLGFGVSGTHFYSWINQQKLANTIWNGGAFGYEGSIVCLFFQLVFIVLIFLIYRNCNNKL